MQNIEDFGNSRSQFSRSQFNSEPVQVMHGFVEEEPDLPGLQGRQVYACTEGTAKARAIHRLQQLEAGQAEAPFGLKEAAVEACSDEGAPNRFNSDSTTDTSSEAKAGMPENSHFPNSDSDYDEPPKPSCNDAPKDISDVGRLLCENARLALENEHLRLVYENARLKSMKEPAEPQGPCFLPLPMNFSMPPSVTVLVPPPAQVPETMLIPKAVPVECPVGQAEIYAEMPMEQRTTVTLRNLPNNYSRAMFLNMLNSEGFAGAYDFVYLPIDFHTQACLGYAFVNLVSPTHVALFWQTFNGFSKWVIPSQKVCSVSWSTPFQGLEAHLDRYKNSPLMHPTVPDNYKPIVFQNGVRAVFPLPTKAIRAPRVRHSVTHGHSRGGMNGSGRVRLQ